MGNKLNNNLHQIQIAIPYGQTDPQMTADLYNNNYALVEKKKKKIGWWRRNWFFVFSISVMIIVICCGIGFLVWNYIQMRKKYNESCDVLNENYENTMRISYANRNDVLNEKKKKIEQPSMTLDEMQRNVALKNESSVISTTPKPESLDEVNKYVNNEFGVTPVDENEYNEFGTDKEYVISGGNKGSKVYTGKTKVWQSLKRDDRGRFIKRNY